MDKLTAKVTKKVQETRDVVTIYLVVNGQALSYVAGQYITVYFEDTGLKSGKAYSLSSSPGDKQLSITVKKIGLFSGKIHSLEVGDELLISKPYGFFNVKDDKPIVAIASGVGIAPIWSIIRDDASRKVELFYSNRSESDIVFKSEIDALADAGALDVHYFVTQASNPDYICRRISVVRDIGELKDVSFYLCGSQNFVTAMWQQLIQAGVSDTSISTETFFENQ